MMLFLVSRRLLRKLWYEPSVFSKTRMELLIGGTTEAGFETAAVESL
jgi:hypothetical protein